MIKTSFNIDLKYRCYQLIEYLMTISDKKFVTEFDVFNKNNWYEIIVRTIKENGSNNTNMLKIVGNVAKHVE